MTTLNLYKISNNNKKRIAAIEEYSENAIVVTTKGKTWVIEEFNKKEDKVNDGSS